MKQEIKDIRTQERQMYVPASVKVMEVTAQRIFCGSTEQYGSEDYNPWL